MVTLLRTPDTHLEYIIFLYQIIQVLLEEVPSL